MSTNHTKEREVLNNTSYNEEVLSVRKPKHEVSPIFINRWSTRAFEPYNIPQEQLNTILEAASYAPSANNVQPWRFFVASTPEQKELFQQFILPRNVAWSHKASAFILLAGDTKKPDGEPNHLHAFDSGAAWATIAYQAKMLGLSTRAMGGYDRDKAKQLLGMPEHYVPHVVIAIGKPGTLDQLDESFHKINAPTPRKSLDELIIPYNVK